MKPVLNGLKTAHDLVTEAAAILAVIGLGLIVFSYVLRGLHPVSFEFADLLGQ